MQDFYNKSLSYLLGLLLLSCILGYLCADKTFLKVPLLPSGSSSIPWRTEPHTDVNEGGNSSIIITDDKFSLSFKFIVSNQAQYPFAALTLLFGNHQGDLVDFSQYEKITFNIKCSSPNTLSFYLITFDEKVSRLNDFLTYRAPATFFSCGQDWSPVNLDLTRLETPQWWFEMFKVALSKKQYELNKVAKISFGSSPQTPRNIESDVHITEVTLVGRNWFYLYLFGGFLVLAWGGYALWFFRQHTRALVRELQDKIQRDRPLIAYQQLSVEPLRDKDRSSILHFMATQYADADLNLEAMATEIGVSRTKINDILKSELGFTFTGYLNKLRLTEAARLLAQEEDANIAEIAYSVGYKNVSYFNKLFKEEYSCTPKTYKSLCDKTEPL
ncbi:MAG TPA: AraC family transcriptional regulator [Cellvibrio sp.]|nr:AraC family transcriptional regulator [Cellvibrio sp.]